MAIMRIVIKIFGRMNTRYLLRSYITFWGKRGVVNKVIIKPLVLMDLKSTYIRKIPKTLMDRIRDVYNACLQDGVFPKTWKKAILILISKGELDMSKPKVWPICLISEMGKLLERVINNRIHDLMFHNPTSRLAKNQYGFCWNMSTYDALIMQVQDFVYKARRRHMVVVGASLDITNAFNSLK